MKTYTFTVGSKSDAGTLNWNPNGTLNQLAIVDGFNAGGTQTCNFTYDDIARLITDNCGSTLWNQSYSYDDYNNITKTGNPGTSWTPGYITSPSSQNRFIGGGYDANGNVTYDLNNTYTWDAYGKMSSANNGTGQAVCGSSGTCVTYDALGRAVEKNVGGVYSEVLYSPIGRTAIMSGATTVSSAQLPMPGGVTLQFSGTGGSGQNVNHADWLGTVRLKNTLSGSVLLDTAYSPYGEAYDTFGSLVNNEVFTGDLQDLFAGLFDTPNREFDQTSGSRWLSPDPSGSGWNLYAYGTNPNSETDPSGLFPQDQQTSSQTPESACDTGATQQQCSTPTPEPTKQEQNASSCGFFCKLGNWISGDGFKTDAEVTEDHRQWLIDHATNNADKDKIKNTDPDKINYTYACLQNSGCAAKYQAYVQALAQFKIPVPGLSGKEGAKDVPSWARGNRPMIGEDGKAFAKRLLDNQYGAGNWDKGTNTEFSQIQKWADRSFMNPPSQ